MKIKRISNNETEVSSYDGAEVLFSYDTPVLIKTDRGVYKTNHSHSKTTSRHINQALYRWGVDVDTLHSREQSYIEHLVSSL